ncbi:uncharacterized protein LOC130996840 [Salvia miltiorrhiza]|uniref:uncharacterized protein LOC130996840 n=1 Tax=Salvia miltiorrhiza TaxID=226208 RepID=UPI0025AB8697|nr:uncharacterized protein LOC130996840 [Salvia miltiorrhiza]
METNHSRLSSLPMFSIEKYDIWKFRLESFLTAQHCRMWEVITNGPITITETVKRVPVDPHQDPYDEVQPKQKADFSTEERKQDELDNLAKSIISGTVPDKHVMKIIKCGTAKEMWDILERMCVGSEEIKENKLSIACQKFDSFLMLKNESVKEMELRFNQILNKVQSISKDKYTQREINLKIH